MLRSEINELENLVGQILDDRKSTAKAGRSGLPQRIEAVKNSCVNLKKKWTQELLSNAREQVIKRYVQFHQASLIKLADLVSLRGSADYTANSPSSQPESGEEAIQQALEDVLNFLHVQFYQYFDTDHPASIYHCHSVQAEAAALTAAIKALQLPAVDKQLMVALYNSFAEITTLGAIEGMSYRQCQHYINVVRLAHRILATEAPATFSLFSALYQFNLNTLHIYHWYRDQVDAEMRKLTNEAERKKLVYERIALLSSIYVNPEKALVPELPSLNDMVIGWLHGQLQPQEPPDQPLRPAQQFPLNLSVPQFALFIRIFLKTGCFPIENVAHITRFFTEHFTTKKQAHISRKSFVRAFYNLDQGAAAIVRDYLQKMLNYLNKTYFP